MMSQKEPRDESSIPAWPAKPDAPEPGELDQQQYKAARKAHELFVSMAKRPDDEAPKGFELFSFLPRLDPNRRNHTILIDGTRGSGKTAVMLRLLQDWSNKLACQEVPKTPLDEHEPPPDVRLVPVGLLDLEAVPQTANLATRIAGMFERVVGAIEGRGTTKDAARSAPAWAALEDDTLKSRQMWHRFVSAAALEWDRSLERRRANIDPEAYAVEVEQAERKGLQARDCFRAFVDALVKDWKEWPLRRGERPFFIVPIDDADLNPGRVVELFGLLRTLWHPRVGYLLTGDSGLFERVLTMHFRVQIDTPMLRAAFGGSIHLALDPTRQAETLSRDLYQKSMPHAQRLKLEMLSGAQRFAVMKDALPRLPKNQRTGETLTEYLESDNFSSLALPGRWRQLNDLRNIIARGDFDGPLGAEHFALELWQHALNDSSLSDRHRDALRKETTIDESRQALTLPYVSIETDINWMNESPPIPGGLPSSVVSPLATVGFRAHWSDGESRLQVRLEDSIVAAMMLTENINRGKQIPLIGRELTVNFRAVEIRIGIPYTYTGRPENQPISLVFGWSIPTWERHLELQRFCKEWKHHVLTLRSGGNLLRLAQDFMSLVLSTNKRRVKPGASWDVLALEIVDAAINDQASDLGRWALYQAGLLATPEAGLRPEDANDWIIALLGAAGANSRNNFISALNVERRNQVYRAVSRLPRPGHVAPLSSTEIGQEVDKALLAINDIAIGYIWNEEVKDPST